MVLDNFEHLVDGAALLAEIVERAPYLTVLVTSRVPLDLGAETVFELAGLSVPPSGTTSDLMSFDAVALFVERAQRLSHKFVAPVRPSKRSRTWHAR